ncbi:MAG TPA: M13 family metallopeptidase [Polyangia bacterium]|jgi:endothelin-converting enzyme/putative endopeptidase|nr:M13 family metallopeptidase [Polyangia bacterium]
MQTGRSCSAFGRGGAALAALLALGTEVSSCATPRAPAPLAQRPARAPEQAAPPAIDLSIIDRKVDPCQDLYQFSCGGWLDATTIPADRPAWSRTLSEINERNLDTLRGILEHDAVSAGADPEGRKLGDLYAACMDPNQAEAASRATLAGEMALIADFSPRGATPTGPGFAALVARLHRDGADELFDFGSQQDFKDARRMIAAADQAGLGLPDRDYYLADDARAAEIRLRYQAYVASVFRLAGSSDALARENAGAVFTIETALARASMPRDQRRDPENIYHLVNRDQLVHLVPRFDWNEYFLALGRPEIDSINMVSPPFFQGLNDVLTRMPSSALRAYLAWHVIERSIPALGSAFVEAEFAFQAHTFGGQQAILPRWKRCVAMVDGSMGQALGKGFVAARFGAAGKSRAQGLVAALEAAMRDDLEEVAWMDVPTRAAALGKLAALQNQTGYPARWRDYSALVVDRSSDLANRMRASAFEMDRQLAKIGRSVDRDDWVMSPQTVNAYYDPSLNEMVLPAGILQPPLFWPARDSRLAFGAIGVIAGHELTHGFDDQGRKFDGQGNLREWWTPAVERAFNDSVQCVVSQYDGYTVLPGVHVQGKLTAGENIADMGGLRLGYRAFREATRASPIGAGAENFTPEQQFFVTFAQSWCTKRRDEYARLMATVDVHAPPRYRVNGAAADLEGFREAFACHAGAALAPARGCRVW